MALLNHLDYEAAVAAGMFSVMSLLHEYISDFYWGSNDLDKILDFYM